MKSFSIDKCSRVRENAQTEGGVLSKVSVLKYNQSQIQPPRVVVIL